MDRQQVKKLALDNGFKLKQQPNGEMDLNPYVYEFAEALLAKANERASELESELLMLTLATGRESTWALGEKLLNKFAIEKKIEGAFKFANFLDANNFSAAIAAEESGFFKLAEIFAQPLRKEQADEKTKS